MTRERKPPTTPCDEQCEEMLRFAKEYEEGLWSLADFETGMRRLSLARGLKVDDLFLMPSKARTRLEMENALSTMLDAAVSIASTLGKSYESPAAFCEYVRDPILRAQHNFKNYTHEAWADDAESVAKLDSLTGVVKSGE